MSHITKEEYLSAFVDGEAGSFEQHRICDQLATDQFMRDKLSSFALIGESIKNRSQSEAMVANSSFLEGIQRAIADDKPFETVQDDAVIVNEGAINNKKKRNFPRQALGYAVAASVVAVAAISFQNFSTTDQNVNQQLASAPLATPEPTDNQARINSLLPATGENRVEPDSATAQSDYSIAEAYQMPDAEIKDLIDKYVAHHLRYASSSTLMPRVRAVSYSTDF